MNTMHHRYTVHTLNGSAFSCNDLACAREYAKTYKGVMWDNTTGKVVSERPQQYGLDFTEADWRLITRALATHIEYGAEKDMSPAYELAECIRWMVNEQWPTYPDDLANHDS